MMKILHGSAVTQTGLGGLDSYGCKFHTVYMCHERLLAVHKVIAITSVTISHTLCPPIVGLVIDRYCYIIISSIYNLPTRTATMNCWIILQFYDRSQSPYPGH